MAKKDGAASVDATKLSSILDQLKNLTPEEQNYIKSQMRKKRAPSYNFEEENALIEKAIRDAKLTDVLQKRQGRTWTKMSEDEQAFHRQRLAELKKEAQGRSDADKYKRALSDYLTGLGLGYLPKAFRKDMVEGGEKTGKPRGRKPKAKATAQ